VKLFLIILSVLFIIQPVSAQIRIIDNCNPSFSNPSILDQLSSNIENIQEKYNGCEQVPEINRKKAGQPQASTARVLADMVAGCFVGLLKGFFTGLKDIITGFWDLTKLGYTLAKKFGKKMVNFLYVAYKSGIATVFSELRRDVQSIGTTILNGLKAIPQMILDAGVKQVAGFKCMNSRARADYVCKSLSYIGTDVLLAVLTGGASKVGYISKVQKAIKLGVSAEKAKVAANISKLVKRTTGILDGLKAQRYLRKSLKGFDTRRAAKIIDQMDNKAGAFKKLLDKTDGELNELVRKFSKMPNGPAKTAFKKQIKAKANKLSKITKEMNEHNKKLSHLRSKKLIFDLDKEGLIEVKRVITDGKLLNDPNLAKGRYPPWSEGGPVYEIKVKKGVKVCRGGAKGEATKGAGRWFLPCAVDKFRSKEDNKWVNATAENPYDEFTKYSLREGDVIQIGGINPITNRFGGKAVFRSKEKAGRIDVVRGGGGEVQLFRESRDKLGVQDVVRTVRVYNSPKIRGLQARAARAKTKRELIDIQNQARELRRTGDLEAKSFLEELEDTVRDEVKELY
jgi:hypothetical protein